MMAMKKNSIVVSFIIEIILVLRSIYHCEEWIIMGISKSSVQTIRIIRVHLCSSVAKIIFYNSIRVNKRFRQ